MANDELKPDKDAQAPAFGVHDYPPIASYDDLLPLTEVAEKFGLKYGTLREMRFKEPRLPYLRFGGKVWVSKTQFVWFLNRWQRERLDAYYLDRKRRVQAGLPIGRGRPPK